MVVRVAVGMIMGVILRMSRIGRVMGGMA